MGSKWKKGSITVFLILIMTLLMSLVLTGIRSVRMSASRSQILTALDIGMFSLFGQYDRELMERYGLFALAGPDERNRPALGLFYHSMEEYLVPVLTEGSLSLQYQGGGFTGYELLTDHNGEAFYRQAVKAESLRTAADSSQESTSILPWEEWKRLGQKLEERLTTELTTLEGQNWEEMEISSEEKKMLQSMLRQRDESVIRRMKLDNTVSTGRLPEDSLSARSLQTGIGISELPNHILPQNDWELFLQYLCRNFSSFENPGSGSIQYGLEFLAIGQKADRENIEDLWEELLLILEGEQMERLGENRRLQEYAAVQEECIQILREILMEDASWPCSYMEYLKWRLSRCSRQELIDRGMELLEQEMRASGRGGFSIDSCVTDLEIMIRVLSDNQKTFQAVRYYGYD